MMLAVVHDDANILERKSSNHTFGEHLLNTLLHRRDVLAWNRTADHFIDELETGSARDRFDSEIHLTELPCPACLLLVAMMAVGRSRHRFAVRNARHTGLALNAVAILHALEHHAQMKVAHAIENCLVEARVMLHTNTRILRNQAV